MGSEDEKFVRIWQALRQCLTDEEWADLEFVICFSPKKPTLLYDETDDQAASIAFANLPSID